MDEFAGAFAGAGADEGIFFCGLFAQAYLTCSLEGLVDNVVAFVEF